MKSSDRNSAMQLSTIVNGWFSLPAVEQIGAQIGQHREFVNQLINQIWIDIISSGTVDIILAQTRARAASDKLYETQRVQSDVSSEPGSATISSQYIRCSRHKPKLESFQPSHSLGTLATKREVLGPSCFYWWRIMIAIFHDETISLLQISILL